MSESSVRCRELAVGHDGRTVVGGVSFALRPGQVAAVVGPSGCGKSTLMRVLAGLDPALSGDAWILGQRLGGLDEAAHDALLRRVGFLFQGSALWSSLTLAENLELPLREFARCGARERRLIALHKLGQVGLLGAADKLPSEISGGMAKRAGLARALALDPEVLFLDEPSAGLDPVTSARLDDLILRLRDGLGTSIVLVSHEVPSIRRLADFCVYLDPESRTMAAEGRIDDFLRPEAHPGARAFFSRQARP
jgi:phospholipid/cholesterol/gamma-HCH transport system ATP-binding protein